ncbi:iron-sulfur cluster biosynthesis family protein (plasmid) [Bacillus megaterium]|nr:iron-sulfur cluster biosynthesis family protein [Priestia megaterium]
MLLKLTEAAFRQLKTMELQKGQTPRIETDITGGCGISIEFTLVIDEPRRNDILLTYESFQIHIDQFTKRYLDEETKIDYRDKEGFLVGESFASNACAFEFN